MRNFKESEFTNYGKMNPELLDLLDELRDNICKIIVLHSDYRDGDTGQHGKGNAVDFHLKTSMPLHMQVSFIVDNLNLLRDKFRLGVYPDWADRGFHLDIKPGEKLYWVARNAPRIDGRTWERKEDQYYSYFNDEGDFLRYVAMELV